MTNDKAEAHYGSKANLILADEAGAGEPEKTSRHIMPERESPNLKETGRKSGSELLLEAIEGEKVGARKLTFNEQCGAFAALYAGVRNQVVARAFGISLQCASYISGCLDNDPEPYHTMIVDKGKGVIEKQTVLQDHNRNRKPSRRKHYEDVGREFEALGKERFSDRYYTDRVHSRITLAKVELAAEARAKKQK